MSNETKIDDGGPVLCFRIAPDGKSAEIASAFSVRDEFAAKAMQAMCAGPGARMVADRDERYDGNTNWGWVVATNAYQMADAMIRERNKGTK